MSLVKTAHGSESLAWGSLLPALFVALLGGTVLFVAGHAQSATLHDTAHDVRHATGFPCH